METYLKAILNLENELSRMNEVSEDVPELLGYAIGLCTVVLYRMFIWTFCNRIQGFIYYFEAKSAFDRIMHLN